MMWISFTLLLILNSKFTIGIEEKMENTMIYLAKYGYLEPNMMKDNETENSEIIKKSLAEFQEFAGMEPTGELDAETINMINMPRCGMKDKISKSGKYALQGSRWKVRNLRYKITKYPRNLERNAVDQTIRKAFQIWSGSSPLTFEPTNNRAHIDIRFEEGRHGDGDAFDGVGGTLAHAYFPQFGGNTHFDDAERWSINTGSGTDLLQVATHEFGHALGLSHSQARPSIMAPFYRGYIPNLNLYADDVTAIQKLYGGRNTQASPGGSPRGQTPRRRYYPRRRFFPRRRVFTRRFPRLRDPVGYIPVYPENRDNSINTQ